MGYGRSAEKAIALDQSGNVIRRGLQRRHFDVGKGPADRRKSCENPNHGLLMLDGDRDDGADAEGTNHPRIDAIIGFRILAVQCFSALNAESGKAAFFL